MAKKFESLFIRPETKKKIKIRAAKKDKSIVQFMEDIFNDDSDTKDIRRKDDFFNM